MINSKSHRFCSHVPGEHPKVANCLLLMIVYRRFAPGCGLWGVGCGSDGVIGSVGRVGSVGSDRVIG
ncbi:MAG: hypothetical protein QNJ37_13910 [Crocosphaera sp.]|nr:hypothetical protein [Crocosphaera sp.]